MANMQCPACQDMLKSSERPLTPYLGWVTFAALLNGAIYSLQ